MLCYAEGSITVDRFESGYICRFFRVCPGSRIKPGYRNPHAPTHPSTQPATPPPPAALAPPAHWPHFGSQRLLQVYNTFAGVQVQEKKFDREANERRIWNMTYLDEGFRVLYGRMEGMSEEEGFIFIMDRDVER